MKAGSFSYTRQVCIDIFNHGHGIVEVYIIECLVTVQCPYLPTSQNDPDCYLIARFRTYTTLYTTRDMGHFRQSSDTEKMHREVVTSSCYSLVPQMLTSLDISKMMSPFLCQTPCLASVAV